VDGLARPEHIEPIAPQLWRYQVISQLPVLGHLGRKVKDLPDDLRADLVVLFVLGLGTLGRDQIMELLVLSRLLQILELGETRQLPLLVYKYIISITFYLFVIHIITTCTEVGTSL